VLGLIEPDFGATRKLDLGDRAPTCFFNVGAANALRSQCFNLGAQIVTHEIELMADAFLGWMNG
jgi:hypothetical protein